MGKEKLLGCLEELVCVRKCTGRDAEGEITISDG